MFAKITDCHLSCLYSYRFLLLLFTEYHSKVEFTSEPEERRDAH